MGKDVYGDVIHIREYKKEDLSALIEKCESKIKNIKIIPCWFGIMPLNIGLNKVPKIAENLCQFWFLVFNKR